MTDMCDVDVRYTDAVAGDTFVSAARRHGLDGTAAKHEAAAYGDGAINPERAAPAGAAEAAR
jgi:hypothetical protein